MQNSLFVEKKKLRKLSSNPYHQLIHSTLIKLRGKEDFAGFSLLMKVLKIVGPREFGRAHEYVEKNKWRLGLGDATRYFFGFLLRYKLPHQKSTQLDKLKAQFLQKTHMFSPEKRDAIAVEVAEEERKLK